MYNFKRVIHSFKTSTQLLYLISILYLTLNSSPYTYYNYVEDYKLIFGQNSLPSFFSLMTLLSYILFSCMIYREDILIFLTGEEEIESVVKTLREVAKTQTGNFP